MPDELHRKLTALLLAAGRPSTRSLARDVGFSHTTVAQLINGSRIPSLNKYRAVVEALDGQWSDFESLYPSPDIRTVVVQEPGHDVLVAILEELREIRSCWGSRVLDDDLNPHPHRCPACLVKSETVAWNGSGDPDRITCFCLEEDCGVVVFSNKPYGPWPGPGPATRTVQKGNQDS